MASLIVVGDVHGAWDEVDERFLESGGFAAALFVGDFGDEDLALVERISRVRCEKAVILGNHDSWNSMSGRDLSRVRRQLDSLGPANLAFDGRLVADSRIGLAGARPFTWGGTYARHAPFYRALYGFAGEADSSAAIVGAAISLPDVPLVFVGHNGPYGLGSSRDSIFGADFTLPPHDHGDRDLSMAIAEVAARGRKVVATVAGHMHHRLLFGGRRRRLVVDGATVHVNAAVVPRHAKLADGLRRHFTRIEIDDASVRSVSDLWVDDRAEIVASDDLLRG